MADKEPIVSEDAKPNKMGLIDRTGRLVHEFFSKPTRTTEAISAGIMSQLEIVHDMQLYPTKYGMNPDQVGTWMVPDNPPAMKWAFDNIGDIWEISVGHGMIRLCLFAVNGMLRSPETVDLQKNILENDKVRNVANKLVGEDRANKLAEGEALQISDDACFWTSLATTFTIKAIHSMGWISLFGIHDHMDNPVPGMIFGQVVAATALAASHYAAKNHESVRDLAIRAGVGLVAKGKSFDKSLQDFTDNLPQILDEKFGATQMRIVKALDDLSKGADALQERLENWNPASSIPSPEELVDRVIAFRAARAKKNIDLSNKDT